MAHKKPLLFITLISIAICISAGSMGPRGNYKNLKVLPADISEKKLDSIMSSYCKALNVDCGFCHVKSKGTFDFNPTKDELDFAEDGKMKEEARKMIHLMIDINKGYFYYDKDIRPEYLNAVSCITCHRGNPLPLDK
ncbi:MAG: c-type cytochrome [Ferruginibacter sp.]